MDTDKRNYCECGCGTEIPSVSKLGRPQRFAHGHNRRGRGQRAIGKRFARLTVVEELSRQGGLRMVRCVCECGGQTTTPLTNLTTGHTRSCGCLHREVTRSRTTHGHARKQNQSRTYITWNAMLARCTNPNADQWEHYGGRGIEVCERWLTFENFLADMGERPEGRSIDRIDVDGNYEPGNCRWATQREQMNNTRRSQRRA